MPKKVLRTICCSFLLFVSFKDSTPIDQNGRLEKGCTLADYFPLSVGNQWTFEVEYMFSKPNMGFPTFYNRRGELSIEIISFSQQNDSLIRYQTTEHFVGVEKRTETIGGPAQSDTALVFNQYRQLEIREQISGRRSDGWSYINVDECHFVEYGNGTFPISFYFNTKRYLSPEYGDTLKVAMGTATGWMFLKNIGPIYYKDLIAGQSSSVRLQIKLVKSEIKNSTGVARQKNMVGRTFQLVQNYPNPFNAITTIGYYQQKTGHVSIKIFSLLGQEMAHLLDENRPAGVHKITWDAGTLSSGIYYYVLETQGVKEIRKAILIK